MNASMRRIFDDVAKFGWHVVGIIVTGEGEIEYSFSVGLFQTYAHPEIVVFGLPMKVAHGVIATCVERIEQGAALHPGEVRIDILNHHSAAILEVDKSYYSDYLGSAIGFYGETDFPALQVVWPDREDRFPWDPNCDMQYASSQTILSVTDA